METSKAANDSHCAQSPIRVQILGPSYRGILLETRTFAQTTLYGKWLQPPNNTKILACPGNTVGAVTHSNTNLKDQSTVYIWMPPESSSPGVFIFVATVAEAYDKYWLGIQSSVMYRGIRASSSANRFTWEAAVLTILFFQLAMFLLL
ncbi:putative ferric-chelate reductase 1 [Hyperolius riggenbachi]|uniref:putative ferric-chelate reductase 1 n=1 Tax=Hyperolius riggenbachi TaxID=752182 RepID=UPI0035A2D6F2